MKLIFHIDIYKVFCSQGVTCVIFNKSYNDQHQAINKSN